jgi:hypothetical protein
MPLPLPLNSVMAGEGGRGVRSVDTGTGTVTVAVTVTAWGEGVTGGEEGGARHPMADIAKINPVMRIRYRMISPLSGRIICFPVTGFSRCKKNNPQKNGIIRESSTRYKADNVLSPSLLP